MKKNFYWSVLIISLVLLTNATYAQKGSVFGVITEKTTGTDLPGASIQLKGTTIGTITDVYGKYILTDLPAGRDTLVFSYVGYQRKIKVVDVQAGKSVEVNVILAPAQVGLHEIVVTGQMLGQAKAINQQLKSDALVNVVSESRIHELPDVNAAEAIGRISGVAVQRSSGEGQKIMLRGLSPKFTEVTINGSRVASNSSTDRSVDLSMISPELLDGIEVYKSPTSDMDGDAVGGTVNLVIKKAPKKKFRIVKAEGAYNDLEKSFHNFRFSGSYGSRFFNNKFGLIVQGNYEDINRGNDLLGTSFTTQGDELYYNYLILSNNQEMRKRMGGSINLDYNIGNGNISLYAFYSKTKRDIYSQSENYSPREYNDVKYSVYERKVDLDILSFALRGNHSIGKLLIDWNLSSSNTNNDTPLGDDMLFRDINAYANTSITDNNFNDWVNEAKKNYSESRLRQSSNSTNSVNEKYYSGFVNLKLPFHLGKKFTGFLKAGGKYTRLNRTRDYNYNYEPKYYLGGPIVADAVKRFPHPIFYTTNGLIATKSFFYGNSPIDGSIFRGQYPFNLNFDRQLVHDWYLAQKDYYMHDRRKDVNDYTALETVTAGYFMGKLNMGKDLTLIAGVRIEASNNTYSGKYSTLSGSYGETGTVLDTTTYQKYTDVLPNFHLIYKPTQWFSIKASAVKTIARPNFNYVSPRTLIDINTNKIHAGNPGLKHMESWGYDLNFSFYNGKYGLFTIGGFYKNIKNIFYIVQDYYIASDSIANALGYPGRKYFYLTNYGNSPKAKVYGLEIDLQTSLKFLPKPFNGIVINANFTRLFSETQKYWFTTRDTIYRDPNTGNIVQKSFVIPKQRDITIPGQVPYILNLSVGYDYKGFSGRVSGVFQGTYLHVPGTQEIESVYSWKFWRWDAALSQKISKHFKVYLNLTNFNNQREESYIDKSTKNPYRIQEYGMLLYLGVQAKF